jgi:hypothetical protein
VNDQLQQLIELQREQNELLKKHLWRLRFSLLSLLILTTVTAVGLGMVMYQIRSANTPSPFAPVRTSVPPMYPPPPVVPNGDINLRRTIPGQT